MAKLNRFEPGGDEDEYVRKCMTCIHSYTRQDESDVLYCRCRTGCNYQPEKRRSNNEQGEHRN